MNFKELYDSVKNSWEFKGQKHKSDFAYKINQLILKKGVNKASLANSLGFSRAYITKVLKGDANLSIDKMTQITAALDAELCLNVVEKGVEGRWIEIYKMKKVSATDKAAYPSNDSFSSDEYVNADAA